MLSKFVVELYTCDRRPCDFLIELTAEANVLDTDTLRVQLLSDPSVPGERCWTPRSEVQVFSILFGTECRIVKTTFPRSCNDWF